MPDIPAQGSSTPLREQIRQDRRWLIVIAALAGMLICLIFLLWPPISPPSTDPFRLLYLRPDRPPFFFLLGAGYAALTGLTLVLLPAPWRSGWIPRRHNLVLTATAMLGFFLFVGVTLTQAMNETHGDHIFLHDSGHSLYHDFTRVRDISEQEAQRLQAEADRRLRENISRAAAGALLIGYAGIAGYGAWWLRARPDWRHPIQIEEAIVDRL